MAVRSFDWVLLRVPGARPAVEPFAVAGPGVYRWPHAKPMIHLAIEVDIRGANACDTLELELRGWQAGDQYCPQGHEHPVKLKDLFQKGRVPSWRRASWPIITGKGKILWAKEFGASAEHSGLLIREIRNSTESFDQKLTS
jgi:tRNA(Ile)-lysidine synthetase-like protein